jgi:hypothetical protein
MVLAMWLWRIGVLWMVAGCANAQSVEGTVRDAATGAGVAGVKVELLRATMHPATLAP